MIEVACTNAEKEKIINALRVMEIPCLFPRSMKTCAFDQTMDCNKCLETKIKWTIK